MTKLNKLTLLLALLMPLTASAYDFFINGMYYFIDGKNATVTKGSSIYRDTYYSGDVVIPSTVSFKGRTYTITRIDNEAFRDCPITSVSIPKTVKTIGYSAFSDCHNLKNVTIGNSVTTIGDAAFFRCTGLTSITLPTSVKEIGYEAFADCYGLENISIPNAVTHIGGNAFNKTIWYNNQPNGLVYIGTIAYKYKGDMPNGTNISIKNGTTCISSEAFMDCVGLLSIDIPNSVKEIGKKSFLNCKNLIEINIPNSVTTIDEKTFYDCVKLKNVSIPNSVTSIGKLAFSGCINLLNVIIPNSVTVIDDGAFSGCTGLESLQIAAKTIGESAFSGCTGLESVIISSSVENIDSYAFSNCKNLREVYCHIRNPWQTKISGVAFYYLKPILFVPADCLMAYQENGEWKRMFKEIVEIEKAKDAQLQRLNNDDRNQSKKAIDFSTMSEEQIRVLGDNYADAENYVKAAECYQRLIDNGNYKANDLFALSNYYLGIAVTESLDDATKADALAKSQKYIDEVDKLVPHNVQIVNQKAKIAKFREGENINGAALGAYQELLSIMNEKEDKARYARYYKYAYNYLATYYYNIGDYTLAKAFYQKWLEYDPENETLRKYVESLEP